MSDGYRVYITRAEDWRQNEGVRIKSREWLKLVKKDPELSLDKSIGPHFVVWSGRSRHAEPWFDLVDGNVEAKDPDPYMIDKMVSIASRLGARVQGADMEIYEGGGKPPRFDYEPGEGLGTKKPWLKRILGG